MKKHFLPSLPETLLFVLFVCGLIPTHAQIVTTIAGDGTNTFSGDGGTASAAAIGTTVAVTTDKRGNVFISDIYSHRIRKINPAGVISAYAGNGIAGFSGDGGPATAAQINEAWHICTDDTGNLYFTDGSYYAIRKVSVSGIISTIAGRGTRMFYGDGGPATAAYFTQPSGLACDRYGNIYVCDGFVNCIRKIDTTGVINTIAGLPFVAGGYSGDGGQATAAKMLQPAGLGIDKVGNLYFFDGGNYRIRKIDTAGTISTFAGDGTAAYNGDGGPATAAAIGTIEEIAVHSDGTVFLLCYNGKIRTVSVTGTINHYSGKGTMTYAGDGLPATDTNVAYNLPSGMAFDGANSLYIADRGNNRLRKIWSATAFTSAINKQQHCFASVYPNPTRNFFHVICTGTQSECVALSVMDLSGRLRYQTTVNAGSEYDLNTDLEPGIYVARFIFQSEIRTQVIEVQ